MGQLLSGCHDGTLRFWDTERRAEGPRLRVLQSDVRAIRLTPDGRSLVVGGTGKTLKLLDASTFQEQRVLWDGASPEKLPVDELPDGDAQGPPGKRWLLVLVFGLGLLVLLGGLAWLTLRRGRPRGTGPSRAEAEPPDAQALHLECAGCAGRLKVRPGLAGKRVKCPHCGQAVAAPAAGPADGSPR